MLVHLRQLRQKLPELDRLFLADPAGILWVSEPENPKAYGKSYAFRDWYRGVSAGWRPYMSEIYLTDRDALAVALAVPIRDRDDAVIGILASNQRLETLRKWLLPIHVAGGDVLVVDRKGQLLFHRMRSGPAHLNDYVHVPAVERVVRGENGVAELDDPVAGGVSLAAYRWLPSLHWGVVVERRKNVALQRSRMLAAVSTGAALVLTGTLGALGWIALRSERKTVAAHAQLEAEIAERGRAEEAAAAANRAKSDFLSRMSHELRTPLNGIIGFAQLLELDVLKPDQRESVEHILKGGRHLLTLINEVLDIARIEAGKLSISLEPVLAGDVVRSALDLIRPQAAARTIQILEPAPLRRYVTADRQRLQQVLLNLLSNAVKYNRQGGVVRVGCEDGPSGRLRFTVADTGGGIAPEMMDRLFRPFDRLGAEQTAIEGTGLGLALSQRLVEAMGGTLTAKSTVGEGTTFTVELLLADGPSLQEHAASAVGTHNDAAPNIRGTVLYIEDNLSNLRLLERITARRSGVTLLSAMQGSRGLELARDHRPDLIILDLHLPDMRGADVLARLRAEPTTKAIPVVILSADATSGQMSKMLEQGARAYLTKPLDVRELLALIDETLRHKEN